MVISLAMVWQIFYPIGFIQSSYDGETCFFRNQTSYYNFGIGSFLVQFIIYVFFVDLHAIIVRIYLYIVMNKKQAKKQQKKEGFSVIQ